jgi:hypothetical protein
MAYMEAAAESARSDVDVAVISGIGKDPEGFNQLVKSALVYGDRITITDPSLLALVFAAQFHGGELGQLDPGLRAAAERASKVDLAFLAAARKQNLLELNVFLNSATLAQGAALDNYWRAVAERLTQRDTYALFDELGGRVFADAIRRGVFSLERPARLRARQPSATAGFLAKLPSFRPATVEDVLGIREELQGSLSRFRAAIAALTREFEHDPTEWEFFDEVEAAWREVVAPALEELQESSHEARFSRQLLTEATSSAQPLLSAALGVATTLSLDTSHILASAVGLAAGGGAALAKAADARRKQRHEVRRRDFFLLSRVDELLGN